MRKGIRAVLERRSDIEVVAETRDGCETLERLERVAVDVTLIDLEMPKLDGLETVRRLCGRDPRVRALVTSASADAETVVRIVEYGGRGFIRKGAGPEELELALRAVAGGEGYLCPSVSRAIIDTYLARTASGEARSGHLTPRQREVLGLVARGWRTKEIAAALGLSVKTVESHRAAIMRRLGVHRMAGLVQEASRMGLLVPGE